MKILVMFSNPPGSTPLRLDQEDRILTALARKYRHSISIERQHATEVEDVHSLLADSEYDVVHFSGHGSPQGMYLDRHDLHSGRGELVSARRLMSLLQLAPRSPRLVILLCCYSTDLWPQLAEVAPFTILVDSAVEDQSCLSFVHGFYDRLMGGSGIQAAYDHARHLLAARTQVSDSFRLLRRCVEHRDGHITIECRPDPTHDSIIINLDLVASAIRATGIGEEQFCHMLSRRLMIHYWIFAVPRDRAMIPIGRQYFGEFSWRNAHDGVTCIRIMRLSSVPANHWEIWSRLLISYNDLASADYRTLPHPAAPENRVALERAVDLMEHHIGKYLRSAGDSAANLRIAAVVPHIQLASAECERARYQLEHEDFPRTLQALELALTNYHDVVDAFCPPADSSDSGKAEE